MFLEQAANSLPTTFFRWTATPFLALSDIGLGMSIVQYNSNGETSLNQTTDITSAALPARFGKIQESMFDTQKALALMIMQSGPYYCGLVLTPDDRWRVYMLS